MHRSLDTAVAELMKRRQDPMLLKAIEAAVPIPAPFLQEARMAFGRPIATPNFETAAFIDLSKRAGLRPLILENTGDRLVAHNEDKRALLQLPVIRSLDPNRQDQVRLFWITDMNRANGKTFSDITTWDGKSLTEFHHELFRMQYPEEEWWDGKEWAARLGGRAREYYVPYLSLFVVHGILCETFVDDKKEGPFLDTVVRPAFEQVRREFGFEPLIVSPVPEDQVRQRKWTAYPKDFEAMIHEAANRAKRKLTA